MAPPYISPKLKRIIQKEVDALVYKLDFIREKKMVNEKEFCGILTYVTFKLIKTYYENGSWYDRMDAEKVCKSALREFERRFIDPYESEKLKINGDV